jgi:hypothetical protein
MSAPGQKRARLVPYTGARKSTPNIKTSEQEIKLMAEGDSTNNDAADSTAGGGGAIEEGGAGRPTSGSEASGADPAGFEPSGVGDAAGEGGGGGEGEGSGSRPGDWNPGEHSGGGGELY